MDGGVQVLPDESVVLHISAGDGLLSRSVRASRHFILLLDKVWLSDVTSGEVPDPVH